MTSSYIEAELIADGVTVEYHIFENDDDVDEWLGGLAIEHLRTHARETWDTLVIHHPHTYHGLGCGCVASDTLTKRKRIVP